MNKNYINITNNNKYANSNNNIITSTNNIVFNKIILNS